MSGPIKVRGSKRARRHTRKAPHLYRGRGTQERELTEFEDRYGARGPYVYGATIGKVRRERAAKRGR